ncbi:MAG: hypothetical protein IPH93_15115 [Saprospiraceae bacterium]|nr:hypothetical protein [Saprospiraceae bacterium]
MNHIDHVVARAADGIRIGLGAVLAAVIMCIFQEILSPYGCILNTKLPE